MSIYAKVAAGVPQSEPIPGREAEMERNAAGGYVFTLDVWDRLDRFLILGTEGGTYYAGVREHTQQAIRSLDEALQADPLRVVARAAQISREGRGIRNDAAIFALAKALKCGSLEARRAAAEQVPVVCRIGTHLFQLAADLEALGGWGRLTKRAVAAWYETMPPDRLAYQLVKYRQRDGWAHRDLLRLSHPTAVGPNAGLLAWVAGKGGALSGIVHGYLQVQAATDPKVVAKLVREYDLPRETIPPEFLKNAVVWEALLERMPLTAMIRNLATMTRVGLLEPMSAGAGQVVSALGDSERLRKSRVHPMALYLALRTYAAGRGVRSRESTWEPNQRIVDALQDAFYGSFRNLPPTGKTVLVGVDVSGSMSAPISGMVGVTAGMAAAAQALVLQRTEPNFEVIGWDTRMVPLRITEHTRLSDIEKQVGAGGGTDMSVPYRVAQGLPVSLSGVIVLTDNETWAGQTHASMELDNLRRRNGHPVMNVNVAMTATRGGADPKDAGTLQVVGFDQTVPEAVRRFLGDSAPTVEEGDG